MRKLCGGQVHSEALLGIGHWIALLVKPLLACWDMVAHRLPPVTSEVTDERPRHYAANQVGQRYL